jgi:hypothetical protein
LIIGPACATSETRLFSVLKQLPLAATPYHRVKALVTTLATLNPVKAERYFGIGMARMVRTTSFYQDQARLTKIGISIAEIIKRSNLSTKLKSRILKRINARSIQGYAPYLQLSVSAQQDAVAYML